MRRVPWIIQGGPNFNVIRVLIRRRHDSHRERRKDQSSDQEARRCSAASTKTEGGAVAEPCTSGPQGNKVLPRASRRSAALLTP